MKEKKNNLLRGLTRKPIAHPPAFQQRKATGESKGELILDENVFFLKKKARKSHKRKH